MISQRGKVNENKKNTSIVMKEERKITCKHYSKEGHDEDHCWKLHRELRPKKFNNKGKQNIVTTRQQDLGFDSGDETKIIAMGMEGISTTASTSSFKKIYNSRNDKERNEIFCIRVVIKHTKVVIFFDSGSQANLISKDIVKKINLKQHLMQSHTLWDGYVEMLNYK